MDFTDPKKREWARMKSRFILYLVLIAISATGIGVGTGRLSLGIATFAGLYAMVFEF